MKRGSCCCHFSLLVLLVAVAASSGAIVVNNHNNNFNNTHNSSLVMTRDGQDAFKKIVNRCVQEYSLTCFKLDVMAVVDRLDAKAELPITASVALVKMPSRARDSILPRQLVMDLASDNSSSTSTSTLDLILVRKIGTFLRSISIRLPVFSDYVLEKLNDLLSAFDFGTGTDVTSGRRKIKTRWLRWAVSVLYALLFGLLAGMVSKSLSLSLLALFMAIASRGFGNFGLFGSPANAAMKSNNYEIIAQPLPAAAIHAYGPATHSSEVKYEDELVAGGNHPMTYVYPRNTPERLEKVLAFHHLANIHKKYYPLDPDAIAYKGYIKETTTGK
ncbi:uncharacterized protein LOC120354226 [Nilaparvata lugens]|uniref:uncharacterized protein LOC120354226 n=1 Tax=Nilaparvata lugens TaxID=108931 RepID=UPI00193DFB03|nr:uncharacterized protein LOC120354226 [Nilaparvata lugens]